MKKISLVLAAFATLLAFTACSDISGSGVSGTGENGLRRLTATVESPDVVALKAQSRSAARTIMTGLEATRDYYLYGTAVNGTKHYEWTEVTPDSNGKFSMNLDSYSWELTLVACKTDVSIGKTDTIDVAKGKALLIATAQVDLTRANAETTFTLRPDGLTTVSSVNLTLALGGSPAWTIPDSVTNVVCGIYSKKDGSIIAGTNATYSNMEIATAITNGTGFPTSFGAFTNVAPGTYLFKVFFCDKKNAAGTPDTSDPLGTWCDDIVILPGTPNAETVTIPNVIDTLPTKPEDFTVCYNETNVDVNPEHYDAVFEWTDKANNELYYEIEVAEYKDRTTAIPTLPASDDDWPVSDSATSADNATSIFYDPSAKNFKSGSLSSYANTDKPKVTLELDLGKQYAARIRAKNRAGNSDWVYVTKKTAAGTDEAVFSGDVINLFRVRYDLNGGTYTPGAVKPGASLAPNGATTGPLNAYATGGIDVVTYLVPTPKVDATTTNTLIRGPYDFKEWRTKPNDSNTKIDTTTDATYAGPDNQCLYAVYNVTGSIGVEDPNDYKLLPGWITVGENATPLTDDGTSVTVDISTNGDLGTTNNDSLVWTIKPADPNAGDADKKWPDDFKYDKIFITVTQGNQTIRLSDTATNVDASTPGTITIEDFILQAGVYQATITAQTAYGNKTYTLPVTLNVTN